MTKTQIRDSGGDLDPNYSSMHGMTVTPIPNQQRQAAVGTPKRAVGRPLTYESAEDRPVNYTVKIPPHLIREIKQRGKSAYIAELVERDLHDAVPLAELDLEQKRRDFEAAECRLKQARNDHAEREERLWREVLGSKNLAILTRTAPWVRAYIERNADKIRRYYFTIDEVLEQWASRRGSLLPDRR